MMLQILLSLQEMFPELLGLELYKVESVTIADQVQNAPQSSSPDAWSQRNNIISKSRRYESVRRHPLQVTEPSYRPFFDRGSLIANESISE